MIGNVRTESQRPVDEGVVILYNDAWSAVIGRVEFLSGLLYREVLYYTLAQVGGKSQKSGAPTAADQHRFHVAVQLPSARKQDGDILCRKSPKSLREGSTTWQSVPGW